LHSRIAQTTEKPGFEALQQKSYTQAEVIAGLTSAQVHELHQRDPAWLTNGAWGVIQFVPGHA
jgi:hypothetical protein